MFAPNKKTSISHFSRIKTKFSSNPHRTTSKGRLARWRGIRRDEGPPPQRAIYQPQHPKTTALARGRRVARSRQALAAASEQGVRGLLSAMWRLNLLTCASLLMHPQFACASLLMHPRAVNTTVLGLAPRSGRHSRPGHRRWPAAAVLGTHLRAAIASHRTIATHTMLTLIASCEHHLLLSLLYMAGLLGTGRLQCEGLSGEGAAGRG